MKIKNRGWILPPEKREFKGKTGVPDVFDVIEEQEFDVIDKDADEQEPTYRDPARLRDLYCNKRLSVERIAKMFDVSKYTIHYWIKKHNIRILTQADRARTLYEEDKCVKMYKNGASQGECVRKFNISYRTLRSILNKRGIPIRTKGEQMKFDQQSKRPPDYVLKAMYVHNNIASIARQLKVCNEAVRAWLIDAGIKIRKPYEKKFDRK